MAASPLETNLQSLQQVIFGKLSRNWSARHSFSPQMSVERIG